MINNPVRVSLSFLLVTFISLFFFTQTLFADYPDSFSSTFALAEKSACKDVVLKIKAVSTDSSIENSITALSKDIFPYRMEVTNGYQHGFFLEALRGYAALQENNPPVAYRHFNNALLYCDEDKIFGQTEPLAEIECAIGDTCTKVGRYMDAKDWLDTAFLDAGTNTRIQAAIDRVLIKRANDIGDYPEIIICYQHLQSIDTLDKDEIAHYAQILFWSRNDRDGFSQLLQGIASQGIDNDLGVKDPLVSSFLNNIMRADDEEVEWFYDLLGWSINDARAKKGDEEYIAFLMTSRTLFCKVYDFLEPEDDLEKVKQRIDVVKKQIADGLDVFGNDKTAQKDRIRMRKRKATANKDASLSETGTIVSSPATEIEDYLMTADWHAKNEEKSTAKMFYTEALEKATGVLANIYYDGTTMQNAANISICLCKMKSDSTLCEYNGYITPDSIRGNILGIYLYARATNDVLEAHYREYFYNPVSIRMSHPIYLRVPKKILKRLCKQANLEQVSILCEKLAKVNTHCLTYIGQQWFVSLFAQGKYQKGIDIMLYEMNYIQGWHDAECYIGWCKNDEDIEKIFKAKKICYLSKALKYENNMGVYQNFLKTLDSDNVINNYNQIFENIKAKKYEDALLLCNDIMYNTFYNPISLLWIKAEIYLQKKEYDKAYSVMNEVLNNKKQLFSFILYDAPVKNHLLENEKRIIKECKRHLTDKQIIIITNTPHYYYEK